MRRNPLFWAGCGLVTALVLVAWVITSAETHESARAAHLESGRDTYTGPPEVIGTAGYFAKPIAFADPDKTARALEQLTGANNEAALIGKPVEVQVSPQQVDSTTAFWADTHHGGQVLVVLSRDRRNEAQRYRSEVAPVDMEAKAGEPVTVSGTIQKVPAPEARVSWGEYDATHRTPLDARVYLKADRVAAQ